MGVRARDGATFRDIGFRNHSDGPTISSNECLCVGRGCPINPRSICNREKDANPLPQIGNTQGSGVLFGNAERRRRSASDCLGYEWDRARQINLAPFSTFTVDLIRVLAKGRTLLIVEHDMRVVFGLADRISVLVYGQLIATGTPEEARKNSAVQEAYLGQSVG